MNPHFSSCILGYVPRRSKSYYGPPLMAFAAERNWALHRPSLRQLTFLGDTPRVPSIIKPPTEGPLMLPWAAGLHSNPGWGTPRVKKCDTANAQNVSAQPGIKVVFVSSFGEGVQPPEAGRWGDGGWNGWCRTSPVIIDRVHTPLHLLICYPCRHTSPMFDLCGPSAILRPRT